MIRPFIPLMWRRGKYIPAGKRKQLYHAYVQSHIIYMLPIYSLGNKTKLDELETMQNKCLKACFRLPRDTSTTFLYSTSILPIHELAIVERVVHLHRMVKSLTKHGLDVRLNRDVRSRSLRRQSCVHVSLAHQSLRRSINEYNRLSSDIRRLDCIDSFRAKVKLKVMNESLNFSAVSPFVFIN